MDKFEEYKAIIKTKMGNKRYIHSINVAKQAVHLAEKYHVDVKKAQTAGILHDITKEMPEEQQLELIKKAGIALTPFQLNVPKLWHSISACVYLRQFLGIEDEDILSAVRYHTTGRKGMSMLEKVIFAADFTGEERNYEGAEEMKAYAEESLDKVILEGVSFSINDLIARKKTIAPDSVDAYNEALINLKNKSEGVIL